MRWSCLGYLADALKSGGRADESLAFYQQAVEEVRVRTLQEGAEGRQAWGDLFWLASNWGLTEANVGNLDGARERMLEGVEAGKKAGAVEIDLLGSEVEVLRIDIMQGKAAQALPQIESCLARAESWWEQYRSGAVPKEAGDARRVYRFLISTLDVANDAYRALKDWTSALRMSDAALKIKEETDAPAHDIASTRFNRASELARLKRFDEARADLEVCLRIFEDTPASRAKVLDSLGTVFRHQGDLHEAAIQTRRALAILNQVPDPFARAISHANLGIYLKLGGNPQFATEASRHSLAALVYRLVSGLQDALQRSLSGYASDFREAKKRGAPLQIPPIHDLVTDPMFRPLSEWLQQRNIGVDTLQTAVDNILAMVKTATEAQQSTGPGDPS
jgi:tetratricopeptide (TPR) repeat protein